MPSNQENSHFDTPLKWKHACDFQPNIIARQRWMFFLQVSMNLSAVTLKVHTRIPLCYRIVMLQSLRHILLFGMFCKSAYLWDTPNAKELVENIH